MEQNSNPFRVKDLYLAAFLHSQGKVLLSVERDGDVCWFVFPDKGSCEKLADQYWGGRATSGAKVLVDSIRTLKDLIFSQK